MNKVNLGFFFHSSGPDGRYNGRSQAFYQDDYSEDETGSSRVSAKGGGTASRSRPRSSGDHRRQPYSHEPRRNTHKLPGEFMKACNEIVSMAPADVHDSTCIL